jgi:hypothetical protein
VVFAPGNNGGERNSGVARGQRIVNVIAQVQRARWMRFPKIL